MNLSFRNSSCPQLPAPKRRAAKGILSGLLLLAFLSEQAAAHSLYLMPAKFRLAAGESLLLSIHNGDAFPFSEGSVDPARLSMPAWVQQHWQIEEFRILGKATHTFLKPTTPTSGLFALSTAPRLLELPPDKFASYLKEEGLQHVLQLRAEHGETNRPSREAYAKHAKTFLQNAAGTADFKVVLGLPLEIVPEADPTLARADGLLPVRLLWKGRPAAGLQVEAAWAQNAKANKSQQQVTIAGRTDADGRILVPINKPGVWRIHAVAMQRATGNSATTADWESDWASLTFARE